MRRECRWICQRRPKQRLENEREGAEGQIEQDDDPEAALDRRDADTLEGSLEEEAGQQRHVKGSVHAFPIGGVQNCTRPPRVGEYTQGVPTNP